MDLTKLDFDLQTVLVIAAIFLIVSILVHGLAKAKRRTAPKAEPRPERDAGEEPARSDDEQAVASSERRSFDPDGIGALRVREEPDFGDEAQEEPAAPAEMTELVIAINVMSKTDEQFNGAVILQTLLSLGFRYGDFNIFHRHREARGKGPILFSLANAVKPGTFDLDNIDTFYTPGLSLFLTLPGPHDPASAYELMLDTAKRLAHELDGVLLDGNRSTLTHQAQQHERERIREFVRRRMAVQKA